MSTNPSPNGKGGGKASNGVSNDADSIMPLLFATIGNPAISFKKMAAMDEHGRTESALEHKFRKWRQKGRDIAAANPEHAGPAAASPTKKPRAPPKKAANSKTKESSEQADVGDEEDEVDDAEEGLGVRQEHDAMVT